MRWRSVLAGSVLAGAAACGMVTAGPAAPGEASVSGGTAALAWGITSPLPGLTALDRGKAADPESLSCAAAGDCAIGGSYTDGAGRRQAFLAGERNSAWGSATEVPGTAALNKGGNAVVTSVSCPAPGDCAAVGQYSPGGRAGGGTGALSAEAFVAVERNGAWRAAVPLRGLAARNKGRSAGAAAVSCWSPGDCTVAGTYAAGVRGRNLVIQAFTAGERNGAWGAVVPLRGLASLNTTGQAQVTALSCARDRRPAGGDCAVGGTYGARAGTEAFVADEARGAWRSAREFPGTASRNTAGAAGISAISCSAAGDCAVAGSYARSTGHGAASGTGFVADSRAWKWSALHRVPGTGDVVSCGSPGNCEAGGTASDGQGPGRSPGAFTADEVRGRWGRPHAVPGLAGPGASVTAISCPAAGECGAGGSAGARAGTAGQAFVVTRDGGRWSAAHQAPSAGGGGSAVTLISCGSPLSCTAAGHDGGGSGVFVMSTAPR